MQLHEFIFSEKRRYKLIRHFAFWASWWLYFLLVFLLYQQPIPGLRMNRYYLTPGDYLPVKTLLLMLLFAIACYPLIYFIIPKFINRKWLIATAYIILLCSLLIVSVSFLFWTFFPFIDSRWGSSKTNPKMSFYWPAANLGLVNFAKVAAAAAIIKYVKYWWLKQKENQRLEKEKINAELQLLKAQVHPDFLFKTLNNIYTHAVTSSPRTSGMLLKLSDLLSYMLYECDESSVPLNKEMDMMKEYMELEKMRNNDDPEIEINIKGNLDGKKIAPFLLLPFIENSFKYSAVKTEKAWINMDISIEEEFFSMTLANSMAPEDKNDEQFSTNSLTNVQKRLSLLYPHQHVLKINREEEMLVVFLKIRLKDLSMEAARKDKGSVAIEPILTEQTNYAPQ